MRWRIFKDPKFIKRCRRLSDDKLLEAVSFDKNPQLIRLGKDKLINMCSCGEIHEFTIEEFVHNKNLRILHISSNITSTAEEDDQVRKEIEKSAREKMLRDLENQKLRTIQRQRNTMYRLERDES